MRRRYMILRRGYGRDISEVSPAQRVREPEEAPDEEGPVQPEALPAGSTPRARRKNAQALPTHEQSFYTVYPAPRPQGTRSTWLRD